MGRFTRFAASAGSSCSEMAILLVLVASVAVISVNGIGEYLNYGFGDVLLAAGGGTETTTGKASRPDVNGVPGPAAPW